jgi:hypothetical protein
MPALQVELPMVSVTTSNPDTAMGEECRKTDLGTVVGEGTRSLDLKVARSLPKAVAAMWKLHQLWEILLTTSWVPDYSEKAVTQ